MKTIVISSAVLIATCGWAPSAYCTPDFVGGFTIQGFAVDSTVTAGPRRQDFNDSNSTSAPNRTTETSNLGGSVGSATAAGDISYSSEPGKLSVSAHAAVKAGGNNGFDQMRIIGGLVKASTYATMQDTWTLQIGHQVENARITSNWQLNGDLMASVEGADGTPENRGFDVVSAIAQAALTVSGAGVRPGPYPSHSGGDYGFFADSIGVNNNPGINPRVENRPPTVIPISVDLTPGNSITVTWAIQLDMFSEVAAKDVINHRGGSALANGDFAHTLTWGGIMSVIDINTGQPITDWTLTSASGFDYTHAYGANPTGVPEPSSILLLTAALGLTLLAAQWRYKQC